MTKNLAIDLDVSTSQTIDINQIFILLSNLINLKDLHVGMHVDNKHSKHICMY